MWWPKSESFSAVTWLHFSDWMSDCLFTGLPISFSLDIEENTGALKIGTLNTGP